MILVGIGGFLGAITRYLIGQWLTPKLSTSFPLTTWLINISGSLVLGILAGLQLPTTLWLFFATGFLGAYTTFSTFGYETLYLIKQKHTRIAIFYVFSSVLVGILFAWFGFLLAYTN